MDKNRDRKVAYGVVVILLVVGVACYAAYPPATPDPPVRLMLRCSYGQIFFDHQTHNAVSGYGLSCDDCHHHPPFDEEAYRACGDCHTAAQPAEGEVSETCLDCHDIEDIEDSEVPVRQDAFHDQCGGCHEDYGAGPSTASDRQECSRCHIL